MTHDGFVIGLERSPLQAICVALRNRIDYGFRRPELLSMKFTAASWLYGNTAAVDATSASLSDGEMGRPGVNSMRAVRAVGRFHRWLERLASQTALSAITLNY